MFNRRDVEQALLALNRSERAAVIHRGIDSLETTEKVAVDLPEIESAWETETYRRLEQVRTNTVELLDLEESHRQLQAELAARRHNPWSCTSE